jgi:4-amino-4-deoxy-L-arabinose transferase-like glycosyltransferase
MRRRLAALIVGVACSWLYLAGLADVPFHPDEASWIYMSGDFDALAHMGPAPLIWRRGELMTTDVFLRLINAPVAKYSIGAGRWLTGHASDRNADWQWGASWEENAQAGTIPSSAVLLASRWTVTLAAVLSIALLFHLTHSMHGVTAAVGATVLLATHPLIMLHTRRAMAEGVAQLFTVIAIVAIRRFADAADRPGDRKGALRTAIAAGVAIGFAVASKQSAAALIPVAFVTAVLVARSKVNGLRAPKRVGFENVAALMIATGLTYFALNPVLYEQPVRAGRSMISMRRALTRSVAGATDVITPRALMPTVASRLSAAWQQMYWNAPSFSEWPTYDDQIAQTVGAYEHRSTARLWNSAAVRLLFVVLSCIGVVCAAGDIGRDRLGPPSRPQQIVLGWFVAEIAFVAAAFTLNWQRYFLPLLPPICLLAGVGAARFCQALRLCVTRSHNRLLC